MKEPEVHEGPQPFRRARYEREEEGVDYLKVAGLLAVIVGAVVGYAIMIWALGSWLGIW